MIADSGTVQEECSIFRIPSVTVRDVTERPETIEAGSNMLAGIRLNGILRAVAVAMSSEPTCATVVKIVLSGAGA